MLSLHAYLIVVPRCCVRPKFDNNDLFCLNRTLFCNNLFLDSFYLLCFSLDYLLWNLKILSFSEKCIAGFVTLIDLFYFKNESPLGTILDRNVVILVQEILQSWYFEALYAVEGLLW